MPQKFKSLYGDFLKHGAHLIIASGDKSVIFKDDTIAPLYSLLDWTDSAPHFKDIFYILSEFGLYE